MEYFVTDFKKCLIAVIIFLILFAIDFIFGLCKGFFVEGVSSSKLRMSVPKFVGYCGMIFMSILLDTLIVTSTDIEYAPIGLISCVCFCIIEISSIVENAKTLGINIPPVITNVISYIKNKLFSDKEEKGGSDTMTFDAWVKKYLGKKIDYDNVSGIQCVDLAKHYMNKVLGLKPASFGNAKCYATDFYDYSFFKNNFELLKNTPDFIPKKGDIGVRITGTYGHIFICDGVGTTSYFYAYDQNHKGKHEPMTRRKMDYSQLQYVLRPKDQSNIVTKVNKPKVKQWGLYTMKTQAYCYKDKNAKDIYTVKEILKINPAVKSLLVSTKSTDKARYKLNVKVTCKSIHEHNGDVIIKTPTCYVRVYSYSKDKSYI